MLLMLLRHLYHNSGICPLRIDYDGMSKSIEPIIAPRRTHNRTSDSSKLEHG